MKNIAETLQDNEIYASLRRENSRKDIKSLISNWEKAIKKPPKSERQKEQEYKEFLHHCDVWCG
jgi:hypothetical protein